MTGLNLVMPMGGGGTRFETAGYRVPKPLIEIYGKPFFYWATQSVVKFIPIYSMTFVVLQEHIDRFHIDREITAYYPDAEIVVIPEVLPGAVMTCLAGLKAVPDHGAVLFNDCDHLFTSKAFCDFCRSEEPDHIDGGLLTFRSKDPRYSFVECDRDGYIIRTVEKQAVSEAAICGAYYFKNKNLFMQAAELYLQDCAYAEFFISGIYNVLARQGKKLRPFPVDHHVSFGTPEEYEQAKYDATYLQLE